MRSGNYLDLDKANNWLEYAAAERITSNPRNQRVDENRQLLDLLSIYSSICKPEKQTYLVNGCLVDDLSIVDQENPHDIDAIMIEQQWNIVWTLKGGQKMDGTGQNYQFDDVVNTIKQSPDIGQTGNVFLAVLVDGDFWTRNNRSIYGNYSTNRGNPKTLKNGKTIQQFSLIDLLNDAAQNKKCLIFHDNNMPKPDFYHSYIQGTSYEQ